ncbi:MAG: carboxypeptidase regulatory-like domain-containing protein [Opitutaceae bacterium]
MSRSLFASHPFHCVRLLLTLLASPAALFGAASGTGVLAGRVSYAVSGEYLELARVTLEGTGRETLTDSVGAYTFADVPAGPVRVRVFYTGLPGESAAVTVNAGETTRRDFALAGEAPRAATAESTVKLDRFVVATSREMDGAAIAVNDHVRARHAKGARGG